MKIDFDNSKTNWKFILIVLILAFIVGGGILGYQYWLVEKMEKETKIPGSKIPNKKEFTEIPLEELKEGRNKIGEIVIEKIKPEVVCDVKDFEGIKTKYVEESKEIGKIGKMTIKFLGWESGHEGGDYEITCNMEDKAKVKIIGWSPGYDEEFSIYIEAFYILDKENKVVDKEETEKELPHPFTKLPKVLSFSFNQKIYFLFSAGIYAGKALAFTEYRLYVIDQNGKVRLIHSWECNEYKESCSLDYVLKYKNNLYLKIGNEIWDLGENDTLKDKFSANKIIIKDSKISFE